jgi:rhodanese-related sulfurtransferase
VLYRLAGTDVADLYAHLRAVAQSHLPDNKQVVAYCRGAYCVLALDAVRLLTARGRAVARLADGMLEWRMAGLPVAA